MTKYYLALLPMFVLACSLTTPLNSDEQAGRMQAPSATERSLPEMETPVQPTPTLVLPTCTVIATALHLRDCAGLHCMVINWLEQGEELTVLDTSIDWIQVQTLTGETGWVKTEYCGEKQ